jgi:hypothetical protein
MTGCVAQRVGIGGVLFPRNNHGLNPDEITLPELLKGQGYATAIIGKWHLGNQDMFQALNHGFDYWYGTPSSNSQGFYPNIKQYAPECVFREDYTRENIMELDEAKCPLLQNNVVVEVPADQTQFTQRYTRETIRFINQNRDKPFFVYLAHNMPHIPLHASEKFVGTDRVIDGKDIWPLLAGKPDAKSPHAAIYYLRGRGVDGIRVGDWKYLAEEPSDKKGSKVEVELTAEEQKLPRKERKALIKERSKAASQKPESYGRRTDSKPRQAAGEYAGNAGFVPGYSR